MLWATESSPVDGAIHQAMTRYLYAASQSTTLNQFVFYSGLGTQGNETYYRYESSPVTPRTTIIRNSNPNELLILMEGMINYDKVAACLAGWVTQVGGGGDLAPYGVGARNIYNYLLGFSPPPGSSWSKVTIAGHSYGGACAPHLAAMNNRITRATELKIYTYGAPKPDNSRHFPARINEATRRVFLTNDPVPDLPPSWEDLENLWVLTGVPTARAWSRWYQDTSGLLPTSAGALISQQRSSFPYPLNYALTLTSWMTGTRAFGNATHALSSYQAAMGTVLPVLIPSSAPATLTVPRVRATPTSRQLEAARDLQIAVSGEAAAANPVDTAIGIVTQVLPIKGERYRGRVIGGKQTILYGNTFVQYVSTRRQRRALVRRLNALSE